MRRFFKKGNTRSESRGLRQGGSFNRQGGGRRGGSMRAKRPNPGENIPVSKFINKATVSATQEEAYQAVNTFESFDIDQRLKANLASKGFKHLTPIQDQSIPYILKGQDLIGAASTGTGKTLAFLIPLLNKVIKDPSQRVLIITPTRELALQIGQELYKLTFMLKVFRVMCIGGASINKQIQELRRPYNFVIGTPGRLNDLAERKVLQLSKMNNVVLDEVDRMLDMGFAPVIKTLMAQVSPQRQSLFFSATIDKKVVSLIGQYSENPAIVEIKSRETAETVDQDIVEFTNPGDKLTILRNLLQTKEFKKILIFGRTKWGVHKLAISLNELGLKAESIHGDKTQSQRQRSLKLFKDGGADILVATDVAARGLDIPGVTHVINYEVPETYADYIHRIGRTGRANAAGKALTFVEAKGQLYR